MIFPVNLVKSSDFAQYSNALLIFFCENNLAPWSPECWDIIDEYIYIYIYVLQWTWNFNIMKYLSCYPLSSVPKIEVEPVLEVTSDEEPPVQWSGIGP